MLRLFIDSLLKNTRYKQASKIENLETRSHYK
jgi:hypothetical protein